MMDFTQLWAELEQDQTWRQDEIRFLQNQITQLSSESDENKFRRAIILLLYAHFEGFIKFAFTLYINSVNTIGLKCGEANPAIAAASLSEIFKQLRNPDRKCPEFRRELPDDSKLHLFAREREFIESLSLFEDQLVQIPEKLVETQNLKPAVLRKNLYRLGFHHEALKEEEGNIYRLLGYRNQIAHGASDQGVSAQDYEQLRNSVFNSMNQVKRFIMDSLQNHSYKKEAP